jgi:hypothetical protein
MGRIWREITGFIWWTNERGSLRYDIMVGLILAFIFFTPRYVFRDQPHAGVEMTQPGVYRIDAEALVPQGMDLDATVAKVLREQTGRDVHVQRLEPMKDAGGTLLAYRVWVQE